MDRSGGGERVVRAPNHLGDLMMALPALQTTDGADVVVKSWLAPLLEAARDGAIENGQSPPFGDVIPLGNGFRGMRAVARTLRERRYQHGVLLTASFSSAAVFWMGRTAERRGLTGDGRGLMLTDPVPRSAVEGTHRAEEYIYLATGVLPEAPPVPRMWVPANTLPTPERLLPGGEGPLIGIVPGSHASSRRWDPARFADLVRRLFTRGMRIVVFGSEVERPLTQLVAGERGTSLGGRTSLPVLAAALARCDLVVSNDTGPLHLASAVGAPTISLWGPGDPAHTGPRGEGDQILRKDLPCIPCEKNECPRSGEGYQLPRAERECLRLISVQEVEKAVLQRLQEEPTRSKDVQ